MALLCKLAYWTGKNAEQMDRLFRRSGKMSAKFDSRRGDTTLGWQDARACELVTTVYEPHDDEGDPGPEYPGEDIPDYEFTKNEKNEESTRGGDNSSNSYFVTSSTPSPGSLGDDAYYGLAGEIVRTIEPETESDSAAILTQLLTGFANAAGRHAYAQVEATRHYPVLNVVLVGTTAKGRKGTSWNHVRYVLNEADHEWASEHVAGGLSSGEGIIHRLRDRSADEMASMDAEQLAKVKDKRLLCYEGEFSSVLAMASRKGNVLSQLLRQTYDGDVLEALTKQSPERAEGTHVSTVGHITKDELLRYITETDAANGFGNRYMWVCSNRSKLLPEGGDIDRLHQQLAPLTRRMRTALDFARTPRKLTRDDEAKDLWAKEYPRLSSGHPGMFGAMTARAEAHVLRLSCVYALLDLSAVVKAMHLRAALAVDRLGDDVADTILDALRASPNGMSRTDISAHLGRNVKASRIAQALKMLLDAHLACVEHITQTGGRPSEIWRATKLRSTKETK